jgi:hypothetical protein
MATSFSGGRSRGYLERTIDHGQGKLKGLMLYYNEKIEQLPKCVGVLNYCFDPNALLLMPRFSQAEEIKTNNK